MSFFLSELVQVSIGNRKFLTRPLSTDEWDTIYNTCELQKVLCVAFSGILKLPEEQMPPSELLGKWQKVVLKEKERRGKVAEICRKACETHGKNGYNSCVLMPCGEYSDPKDVDILCWSKEKKEGQRTIVEYVNFQYVSSTHHIKPKVVRNFTDIESGNIPMDVHFKSDYLNCPWYNNRFEAWVREMVERSFLPSSSIEREPEGDYISPLKMDSLPCEFYVVYQLLHLYRKLFCEGIRLGHLLEYYYTLSEFRGERTGAQPTVGNPMLITSEYVQSGARDRVMHIIECLGMKKFAGAVMYVMQTVFAMTDEFLICQPNQRNGSFVLSITLQAGEYTRVIERTRTLSHLGRIGHHLYWLKRNRPFITQYPAEMFFELYKRMKG